jgi:hypothetical protein
MVTKLMALENLEYDQAYYCLDKTGFRSVEASKYYINHKNAKGKLTHKLEQLGKKCFVCD